MDLMAAELKREQELDAKKKATKEAAGSAAGEGEEGEPFDKFQYLVGQSEVFAHFLAGK